MSLMPTEAQKAWSQGLADGANLCVELNVEQVAEALHRMYRAAFKALHGKPDVYNDYGAEVWNFNECTGAHDHGWSHCDKKKYFLKRAAMFKKELQC